MSNKAYTYIEEADTEEFERYFHKKTPLAFVSDEDRAQHLFQSYTAQPPKDLPVVDNELMEKVINEGVLLYDCYCGATDRQKAEDRLRAILERQANNAGKQLIKENSHLITEAVLMSEYRLRIFRYKGILAWIIEPYGQQIQHILLLSPRHGMWVKESHGTNANDAVLKHAVSMTRDVATYHVIRIRQLERGLLQHIKNAVSPYTHYWFELMAKVEHSDVSYIKETYFKTSVNYVLHILSEKNEKARVSYWMTLLNSRVLKPYLSDAQYKVYQKAVSVCHQSAAGFLMCAHPNSIYIQRLADLEILPFLEYRNSREKNIYSLWLFHKYILKGTSAYSKTLDTVRLLSASTDIKDKYTKQVESARDSGYLFEGAIQSSDSLRDYSIPSLLLEIFLSYLPLKTHAAFLQAVYTVLSNLYIGECVFDDVTIEEMTEEEKNFVEDLDKQTLLSSFVAPPIKSGSIIQDMCGKVSEFRFLRPRVPKLPDLCRQEEAFSPPSDEWLLMLKRLSFYRVDFIHFDVSKDELRHELYDFLFKLSGKQIPLSKTEYRYLTMCKTYGWHLPNDIKKAVRQHGKILNLRGNRKQRERISVLLDLYQRFTNKLANGISKGLSGTRKHTTVEHQAYDDEYDTDQEPVMPEIRCDADAYIKESFLYKDVSTVLSDCYEVTEELAKGYGRLDFSPFPSNICCSTSEKRHKQWTRTYLGHDVGDLVRISRNLYIRVLNQYSELSEYIERAYELKAQSVSQLLSDWENTLSNIIEGLCLPVEVVYGNGRIMHYHLLFAYINHGMDESDLSPEMPTSIITSYPWVSSHYWHHLPSSDSKVTGLSPDVRQTVCEYLDSVFANFFDGNRCIAAAWFKEKRLSDRYEDTEQRRFWLKWALIELWAEKMGATFPVLHHKVESLCRKALEKKKGGDAAPVSVEKHIEENLLLSRQAWQKKIVIQSINNID